MKRALGLSAVIALIVFTTTALSGSFVGHSHWQLVEWVPFTGGIRPFDIVANVALFVPLGWGIAWRQSRPLVARAVLAGAVLSIAIELFQVYCHGHFPTMTDVLTNTCGTWLGARIAGGTAGRATAPNPL